MMRQKSFRKLENEGNVDSTAQNNVIEDSETYCCVIILIRDISFFKSCENLTSVENFIFFLSSRWRAI